MMTDRKTDVLCIGQAVIDCITRGQEPDRHRENVYRAERIELHVGGDAVNESIALAQMGLRPAIACAVGPDLAGNILRAELSRTGVDTSRIEMLASVTTPVAQLVVHRDGGRHSINSRATMLDGYIPSAERLRLQDTRIVSLASLFRAPFDRAETIRDIVRAAKKAGAVVCADTKLPTFREVRMEELADVWPLIDYIFPNEKEAAYYASQRTGEDPAGGSRETGADKNMSAAGKDDTGKFAGPENAEEEFWHMTAAFRRYGVRNVIIKAGADGCYVDGCGSDGREERFHLPARQVEVIDSTGAGDNFVAGFLRGILCGDGLRACAERGQDRAALCIGRMGAQ